MAMSGQGKGSAVDASAVIRAAAEQPRRRFSRGTTFFHEAAHENEEVNLKNFPLPVKGPFAYNS